MRGVAGGGAGRGSHDGIVAVAGGWDDGIDVAVAADGAGVRGVAGGGAGRSSHGVRVLMTGSVDIVIAVAVAADGADVVRVAVLLTGRGNDRGLIAVAGGRDKVRLDLIAAGGAGVDRVALLRAGRGDDRRHSERMLALALGQLLPDQDGIAAVDLLHAGAVCLEGLTQCGNEVGGLHVLLGHFLQDGRVLQRGVAHLSDALEAAGKIVDVLNLMIAGLGIIRMHEADGCAGISGGLQAEVGHGAGVVAVVDVALRVAPHAALEIADKAADAAVVLVAVAGDRAGVVAVDDVGDAVRAV